MRNCLNSFVIEVTLNTGLKAGVNERFANIWTMPPAQRANSRTRVWRHRRRAGGHCPLRLGRFHSRTKAARYVQSGSDRRIPKTQARRESWRTAALGRFHRRGRGDVGGMLSAPTSRSQIAVAKASSRPTIWDDTEAIPPSTSQLPPNDSQKFLQLIHSQKKRGTKKNNYPDDDGDREHDRFLQQPHLLPTIQPPMIGPPANCGQQRSGEANLDQTSEQFSSLQSSGMTPH